MRRTYGILVLASALLCAACEQPPASAAGAPSLPPELNAEPKKPLELPADLAGFAKLGVNVPKDSMLVEGPEGLQFEESPIKYAVRAKFYVQGLPESVATAIQAGLQDVNVAGGGDERRITGKTKDGDLVEIMLGPGANREKTMVLAWVTREK